MQLRSHVRPGASRNSRPVTVPARVPHTGYLTGTRRRTRRAGRDAICSPRNSGFPRQAAAGARPRSAGCGLRPWQPGTESPPMHSLPPCLPGSRRGTERRLGEHAAAHFAAALGDRTATDPVSGAGGRLGFGPAADGAGGLRPSRRFLTASGRPRLRCRSAPDDGATPGMAGTWRSMSGP